MSYEIGNLVNYICNIILFFGYYSDKDVIDECIFDYGGNHIKITQRLCIILRKEVIQL